MNIGGILSIIQKQVNKFMVDKEMKAFLSTLNVRPYKGIDFDNLMFFVHKNPKDQSTECDKS